MPRSEEDKQVDLTIEDDIKTVRSANSGYSSRKFATSSTEKFRDIFYQQITDEDEVEARRKKLLGEC